MRSRGLRWGLLALEKKEVTMAKADDDKKGLAIIRQVETRLFWAAAFLVRARGSLSSSAAKAADEALDEYQSRFPAIAPHELPDG